MYGQSRYFEFSDSIPKSRPRVLVSLMSIVEYGTKSFTPCLPEHGVHFDPFFIGLVESTVSSGYFQCLSLASASM